MTFKGIDVYKICKAIEAEGKEIHHTSFASGYIPKGVVIVLPYSGRFGKGYTVEDHFDSSRYHYKTYLVESGVNDGN